MAVRTVNILRPRPGRREILERILKEEAPSIRSLPGCVEWEVWADQSVLVILAVWATEKDLVDQADSPAATRAVERVREADCLRVQPLDGRFVLDPMI